MQLIALVANLEKRGIREVATGIITYLEERGVRTIIARKQALALGVPERGVAEQELQGADCLLVLGGDGTLLQAARQVCTSATPILGINLGRLGFLTEVELADLYPALDKLLTGDYHIEQRMMLQSTVKRPDQILTCTALNDIVVTKGAFPRLLSLEVYISSDYLDTYPADGLIVATPTGSTAYSLSAGGPLLTPDLRVMLLTPICPHTLYARPLVVPGKHQIEIHVHAPEVEVMLAVDGQQGLSLRNGDVITVTEASTTTQLIRLQDKTFFSLVRQKLQEGGNRQL